MAPQLEHPPLRQTLEKIRWRLGLKDQDYAGILGVNPEDWLKVKRSEEEVGIRMVMNLAERLNLGFESLVEDSYDPVAMEMQFFGAKLTLPERYANAAFSKVRTSANIVNFVEKNFGTERKFQMLRNFQIKDSMLADQDRVVSLRLSMDLTEWIHSRIQSRRTLFDMGKHVTTEQLAGVGSQLPTSAAKRYEWYIEEFVTKSLEKSYSWKIYSSKSGSLIIRGMPREELFEAIPKDLRENDRPCEVRRGMLAALAAIGENPAPVKIEHTACIARGDFYCDYFIQLS